ncbi:sulfate ABC transporter permease subunit CysW [Bartonella sp. LJL80]
MDKPKRRLFADPAGETPFVRFGAILIVLLFLALVLFMPVILIFYEALRFGWSFFFDSIRDPESLSSIKLTLIVALVSVPINTVFGIFAAWAITKFEFRGKTFLITLIDLPFSVSPVVAGLALVLLFGPQSWFLEFFPQSFSNWLRADGFQILFAVPGVVLATLFVTFPFVARELIPLMQDQGTGDEEAALSLGASGFKTFLYVTLPNIRWGLLYGILLCNARAMGEFGAVALVSGKLRGETVTMPLQVEILYYDNYAAAFAVASLLACLALVTLIIKTLLEKIYSRSARSAH